MLKKFGMILIALFIITLSSMTVYAGYTGEYEDTGLFTPLSVQNVVSEEDLAREQFRSEYDNALKDGKALDNDLSLMTITKPETDEDSTLIKSYKLSGKSDYDDVVVSVARLNRGKGEYELIKNTAGDSSWGADGGFFTVEISLADGVNNLMFISYRESEMEAGKIQFNSVTIQRMRERVAETAVSKRVINPESSIQSNIEITIDMFGGRSK